MWGLLLHVWSLHHFVYSVLLFSAWWASLDDWMPLCMCRRWMLLLKYQCLMNSYAGPLRLHESLQVICAGHINEWCFEEKMSCDLDVPVWQNQLLFPDIHISVKSAKQEERNRKTGRHTMMVTSWISRRRAHTVFAIADWITRTPL